MFFPHHPGEFDDEFDDELPTADDEGFEGAAVELWTRLGGAETEGALTVGRGAYTLGAGVSFFLGL